MFDGSGCQRRDLQEHELQDELVRQASNEVNDFGPIMFLLKDPVITEVTRAK